MQAEPIIRNLSSSMGQHTTDLEVQLALVRAQLAEAQTELAEARAAAQKAEEDAPVGEK